MLKQTGLKPLPPPDDANVLGDVDEVDVLADVDHPSEEPAAPASPVVAGLCNRCGNRPAKVVDVKQSVLSDHQQGWGITVYRWSNGVRAASHRWRCPRHIWPDPLR